MSLSTPTNKNAIRTIVVDDELLARKNLILFLQEFCEGIDIIGDADSLQTAYDLIIKEQPDLVFLDIRMPSGAEGFDLLQKFENPNFKVVFVTAFKDYAIQAFKANAIDYILKPVEIEETAKSSRENQKFSSFYRNQCRSISELITTFGKYV
jgi:two-component system, LytTR family, response regulator